MLRSFLAQSRPFLSRLRPIRRHPCAWSYSSGAAESRHLYVALEDSNGHALYKLNVDDLAGDDSDIGSAVTTRVEEPQRLPQPVLRLSFRSFGKAQFNALGSKIVVTTGSLCTGRESSKCLTLVYDTKTAKQDIHPFVPDGLTETYDAVAAGNKLYAFDGHSLPLYYLRDARAHPESNDDDDTDSESAADNDQLGYDYIDDEDDVDRLREQAEERWTWKRSPMSIPFEEKHGKFSVISSAVHPDGRTIFLTTVDHHHSAKEHSTSFLDTDQAGGGKWTHLGDWRLPFFGRADYDRELDAWVRFTYFHDTKGQHLCTCDLPATGGKYPTPQPAWKLSKGELTFMQAPLSAMCANLVHTGPGRFCLVEIAPFTRFSTQRRCLDIDQDLLQVTMFRARYGRNGELTATPLRPGQSYLIPAYESYTISQPPAFWM